jgi:hypothetical protein
MRQRLLTWFVLPLLLLVIAIMAYSRATGTLLQHSDGRMLGYSKPLGQWLLNTYPAVPPRRDGPYVFHEAGAARSLRLDGEGAAIALVAADVDGQVNVVVDDDAATTFLVPLRAAHPRARLRWPMPSRLLVLSDLEGEFAAFAQLLRGNGVIDADLHWRFGDGHVVLVGDMVDRGHNVVPLLWLVYRLEAEAAAAGGALHYVLGNHEQMLLLGQTPYVAPKYYASFRLTGRTQRELWSEASELGRWLRSKPVLLQIGDVLFVHGGISGEVVASGLGIDAIDAIAAQHIATLPRAVGDEVAREVLSGRNGLLWYRGLATASKRYAKATDDEVACLLAHFGAARIAIGHSLAAHVGSDYGGRVLRVDVAHADGVNEALLIEDGAFHVVDAGGRRAPLLPVRNL